MAKAEMEVAAPDLAAEVAELRERVQHLEEALASVQKPADTQGTRPYPLPGLVDKEQRRAAWEEYCRRRGWPLEPPSWTARELREEQERRGLRAEDRVAQTILMKMRGYDE